MSPLLVLSPAVAFVPGDVNDDGVVDITDVAVLQRDLAELGPGITQTCVEADADGDGFTVAGGDCDDTNPLISPAAFDVPGNGMDDDCADGVDTPQAVCDAGLSSDTTDPVEFAQALDLCQTTAEVALPGQRTWGLIGAALSLPSGFGSPSPLAHSIRDQFGPDNTPRRGNAFLVLATGTAAAPGQTNPSHAAFQPGVDLGLTSPMPSDWLFANGGAQPNTPGCPAPSDPTLAFDPVMLKLRLRVPTNAQSFRLRARFFSSEYPEYVCSPFNDFFVVLLDSTFAGVPPNPTDKNLALLDSGMVLHPIGVNLAVGNTGVLTACLNGPTGCALGAIPGSHTACTSTLGIAGTGMDVLNPPGLGGQPGWCGSSNAAGAGSSWLAISGNVVPGETIELRIGLWDTADENLDSFALLDGFEWSTGLTQPGAVVE